MRSADPYLRAIHTQQAQCDCFGHRCPKDYFLSSHKSMDSRKGNALVTRQQLTMLKTGHPKISLKKTSLKSRPISPHQLHTSVDMLRRGDFTIRERQPHIRHSAKMGLPNQPIPQRYSGYQSAKMTPHYVEPKFHGAREVKQDNQTPLRVTFGSVAMQSHVRSQPKNRMPTPEQKRVYPAASLAQVKQKVELPPIDLSPRLKTYRSDGPSEMKYSNSTQKMGMLLNLPEDQPLVSSRQREDTVIPMGRVSARKSPRKRRSSRLEVPDTAQGIFGSNIENSGDSLMVRRGSRDARPLLKKISDVNQIQSVRDSNSQSNSSKESIVLGRANTNNFKMDLGRIGGSMLNISKSLSSPSLKSKLMSVQTHQSSVGKSFLNKDKAISQNKIV